MNNQMYILLITILLAALKSHSIKKIALTFEIRCTPAAFSNITQSPDLHHVMEIHDVMQWMFSTSDCPKCRPDCEEDLDSDFFFQIYCHVS